MWERGVNIAQWLSLECEMPLIQFSPLHTRMKTMHGLYANTTLLHIRGLNICEQQYPREFLEPIPCEYEGKTVNGTCCVSGHYKRTRAEVFLGIYLLNPYLSSSSVGRTFPVPLQKTIWIALILSHQREQLSDLKSRVLLPSLRSVKTMKCKLEN